MTTYFAIADLYGRFDLLEKAIDAAAKYAEDKGLDADECRLITLGDYIDRGKHVVHGHHQFADGPHTWAGRTDLDTFAWKTGRIVVGVFNDTQGPAVDFIEVKYD